jgi:hypothetical protein
MRFAEKVVRIDDRRNPSKVNNQSAVTAHSN